MSEEHQQKRQLRQQQQSEALIRVGKKKPVRKIDESNRRKPPWKVWKVPLETIRSSNISGLVELLLTALPFLIPQLGIPAMILLRILQGQQQYGGHATALTYEHGEPDVVPVFDVENPEEIALVHRCKCGPRRANTLVLPCTHQVWCSVCAAEAIRDAEQADPSVYAQCPDCGVTVQKVIRLR